MHVTRTHDAGDADAGASSQTTQRRPGPRCPVRVQLTIGPTVRRVRLLRRRRHIAAVTSS